MFNNEITISVLKNFDGFNAHPIEVVTRKYRKTGRKDRYGNPQKQQKIVSYKGKQYTVFALPDSYGLEVNQCINYLF